MTLADSSLRSSSHPIHENANHALVEAKLLTGDRLANESNSRENLSGRDIGARVSTIDCSMKKPLERRFEAVQQMFWEIVVRWVT